MKSLWLHFAITSAEYGNSQGLRCCVSGTHEAT